MSSSGEIEHLPWPECLGTFDEESCRFFLRELGQRIVQFYPFSVGIDEVYTQIVDKYGFIAAPDVISVLQELLEDDAAADGAGDDGDIWRSWRWSWRHRNDSIHTPHVPRAHGRLLPPPTSTRIRLLKSANFLAADCKHHSNLTEDVTGRRSSIISTIYEDGPPAEFLARTIPRSVSAGVLDFHRTIRPYANHPASRDLVSYKNTSQSFDEVRKTSSHAVSTRFKVVDGSPHRSLPALPNRIYDHTTRVFSENQAETLDEHWSTVKCKDAPVASLFTQADVIETDDLPTVSTTGVLEPDVDKRLSLPSDLSTESQLKSRNKRHRQVRMIDGALVGGRQRSRTVTEDVQIDLHPSLSKSSFVESPARSFRSKEHSSRVTWLQDIFHRFRNCQQKQRKSPQISRKRSSLFGKLRSDMCEKPARMAQHINQVDSHERPGRQFNGLDGTDDRVLSNNKPLPLSPGEESGRPSIQSDVQRAFFGFDSPAISIDPSPQFYSPHSGSHYGAELKSMVSATMTGPGELSLNEKALRYRFSQSSNGSVQTPSASTSTPSQISPSKWTVGAKVAKLPMTGYESEDGAKRAIVSNEWPFRQGSPTRRQDANNLHERRIRSPVTPIETVPQQQRGRRPSTPVTPTHASKPSLNSPPKKPRQRSKSPVKKFLGMVKSLSANQLPANHLDEKEDTPDSSRGRWKELSHKLRHGFLTADLEQLDREAMMEQYTADNNGNFRIITPPPSRSRTVFPISIRSSGQSKMWSELEYMLTETCNTFLKDELSSNRLSRESIIKVKRQWQSRNRPQVVEFYYDQATQYDLVIANLRTVRLYSDYSQDAVMLNSVLHQWKILVRELNVKTLCMPDSIVRRWLHDGRRVLELLGATQVTLANMDKLTTLCLAVISSAEKERARRVVRDQLQSAHRTHRRSVSDGSQRTLAMHEQALDHNISDYPPLPTSEAVFKGVRGASDKEHRAGLQGDAAYATQEPVPFTFTHGKGHLPQPRSMGQNGWSG